MTCTHERKAAVARSQCQRVIQRAGGYFDKTIGSMEGCPPVYAVVYDSELLDEVPRDVHDQPVTGVVTPTQTLRLAPARR